MKHKVMVVGNGSIGGAHIKDMPAERTDLVAVVDSEEEKLSNEAYEARNMGEEATKKFAEAQKFTDLTQGIIKTRPDLILVAANTPQRISIVNKLTYHVSDNYRPKLFLEKPVEETMERAVIVERALKEKGYGDLDIALGYLIRYSPALDQFIDMQKGDERKITEIDVLWNNRWNATRPCSGAITDEATHAMDTIIRYTLPNLGYPTDNVEVNDVKGIRSLEFVDSNLQRRMFSEQWQRRFDELAKEGRNIAEAAGGAWEYITPIGQAEYDVNANGIRITGHSSFVRLPRKRRISFGMDDKSVTTVWFDEVKDGVVYDRVIVESPGKETLIFDHKMDPSRITREWNGFLNQIETGKKVPKVATLEDGMFDMEITSRLTKAANSHEHKTYLN